MARKSCASTRSQPDFIPIRYAIAHGSWSLKPLTIRRFLVPVVLAVSLAFIACNSGSGVTQETKPTTVEPTLSPAPPSPWNVSTSSNELSGEINITAISGYGDQSVVVRQRGKKLDRYVNTGRFLETVDNMDSRRSPVEFKFDDGPIVRQEWTISDDNDALFYPGDSTAFLQNMRKAKRFVIEYKPADVVPQTASFDVSQFPSAFSERLKVVRNTAPKEARKAVVPCDPSYCRQQYDIPSETKHGGLAFDDWVKMGFCTEPK